MSGLEDLGDGLWRWTLPHPGWRPPTELGAELACFAVRAGEDTVLIDPLLDDDADRVLVTRGVPVLHGGRDAPAEALAAEPWSHPPHQCPEEEQ
jgi:hypothetical protein